jgi:site-specific recombinase XerD
MLHRYCSQFFAYCQLADFSARSIQALTIRLNEFKAFLKSQRIRSVKKITYQHLINFENQGDASKIIRLHPSIRETYKFKDVAEVTSKQMKKETPKFNPAPLCSL